MICQFCKSALIVYRYTPCHNCYPIYYLQDVNNKIIVFIVKSNKKYTIYYDYCFNDLTFKIDIYNNINILSKSFKKIKISSAKELESFGNRIYNLLVFT